MPAGKKDNWCSGGGIWFEDATKASIERCNKCGRRLRLKTILHQPPYGEKYGIDGYKIPAHKEKK